jgi:hypothetical protein
MSYMGMDQVFRREQSHKSNANLSQSNDALGATCCGAMTGMEKGARVKSTRPAVRLYSSVGAAEITARQPGAVL